MSVWIIIAIILFAFCCLACSMPKHQPDVLSGTLSQHSCRIFQGLAWGSLSLALALCIDQLGASIGISMFIGGLSVAAGLLLLIMSYQPQRLMQYVTGLLLLSLLLAMCF